MPLSCAQAPQRVCVLPSASMVIQYRGASLLTLWLKRMASSANSSDSRIANMSSMCLLMLQSDCMYDTTESVEARDLSVSR